MTSATIGRSPTVTLVAATSRVRDSPTAVTPAARTDHRRRGWFRRVRRPLRRHRPTRKVACTRPEPSSLAQRLPCRRPRRLGNQTRGCGTGQQVRRGFDAAVRSSGNAVPTDTTHTEARAAIAREGVSATNTVDTAKGGRDDGRDREVAEFEASCRHRNDDERHVTGEGTPSGDEPFDPGRLGTHDSTPQTRRSDSTARPRKTNIGSGSDSEGDCRRSESRRGSTHDVLPRIFPLAWPRSNPGVRRAVSRPQSAKASEPASGVFTAERPRDAWHPRLRRRT